MSSTPHESRIDGIDYWATRWKEQKTGWHIAKVHPTLIQFMDRLVPSSESKKFFLPLCGMTYDIGYLLGLGHKVFGVEGVKEVIHDLNVRDNLGMEFSDKDSAYSSPDGSVVIYIGDIMECPIENWGPVDVVWDRASLFALNYVHRSPYVEVIKRSVRDSKNQYCEFSILLDIVRFEKTLYDGPPWPLDDNDMNALFSDWTQIEFLQKLPIETQLPGVRQAIPEGNDADVITYLLTPKS